MKNILKSKKYTDFFPLISLIFGIFLCFYMVNQLEKKHLVEETDINLLKASKSIKYILGNDYITSTMDNSTYSKEYILEKGSLLNEMSKELNVDYLYLLVKKDDDIHYAIMSDTLDFLREHPTGYYWESLKSAEDDSFELTWKTFDSGEPVFLNSSDIWGSYRSVYVREISKDGTVYIAGADIENSSLNGHLSQHTLILLLNTVVTLLFAIPLMFSFRKLTLESFSLKKESGFIKSKDPLTGAYNRKKGIDIFKELAEKFKDGEDPLSTCLIDIKNLGYINKKMGLKAGDDIVKIVVSILKQNFRNNDKVVRLEGDKLMIILPDCSKNARGILIKKLKNRLSIFNKMNKKNYYIELSYLYIQYEGENIEEFVDQSLNRLALHKKNKGIEETIIQEEILLGMKNNEFKTFFQPKIFSQDKKVQFEALVRWFHPEKGMIPPDKFIPVAESSFLIHKITEMVLKDSLEAAKLLNTRISVNISSIVFEDERFVRDIKNVLEEYESRNLITLEITERVAMKHSFSTLKKMKKLIKLGIEFSIDDFGTGYSSLSYLEKFPISELKIDRSFINNLEINKINSLVINFSVKIAELAGFKVIAEGVETKEQIEKLMSLGCYNFQGYYFDKAQPLDLILKDYSQDKYLNKMGPILIKDQNKV